MRRRRRRRVFIGGWVRIICRLLDDNASRHRRRFDGGHKRRNSAPAAGVGGAPGSFRSGEAGARGVGMATALDAGHHELPPVDPAAGETAWSGSSRLGGGPETLLDRRVAEGRRRRTTGLREEATRPDVAYDGREAPGRC